MIIIGFCYVAADVTVCSLSPVCFLSSLPNSDTNVRYGIWWFDSSFDYEL